MNYQVLNSGGNPASCETNPDALFLSMESAQDYIEYLNDLEQGDFTIKELNHFPNGLDSWQETHFEVVQAITMELNRNALVGKVAEVQEAQGHGGLYELAKELTDEFEILNCNRQWDGDFFDEIDEFLKLKL